jgi:hypothetical protein
MENSFHFFPLWKRGMKGDLTAFQKAKRLRFFFLAHPCAKINGISLSKEGAESYNEKRSKTQLSRDGGAECVPGQAFSLEVSLPSSSFLLVK